MKKYIRDHIVSTFNNKLMIAVMLCMAASSASAESPFGTNGVFYKLFTDINGLISGAVISLLIGITIALFFWALVRSMARSQGGTKMAENKAVMGYGIAILFVMVSIWGIIVFFQDAILGKEYGNIKTIDLPTIPQVGAKATTDTNNPVTGATNKGGTPPRSMRKPLGATCTTNTDCMSNKCYGDGPKDSNDFISNKTCQ